MRFVDRAALAWVSVLSAIAAGCGPEPPPAPPISPGSSVTVEPADPALGPALPAWLAEREGHRMLRGVRIASAAPGEAPVVSKERVSHLAGSLVLPAHLGGGHLFWGDRWLWRAPTFSGELTPLTYVKETPERVELGPDFVLAVGRFYRLAVSPSTGKYVAERPLGAHAIGQGSDVTVAATVLGSVLLSTDQGKRWTNISARIPAGMTGIDVHEGRPRLLFGDHARVVNQDGSFGAPVRATPQAPNPAPHAALLRAVAERGALVDSRHAIVPKGDAVLEVTLAWPPRTKVVRGPALSAKARCEAVALGSDVAIVCDDGTVTTGYVGAEAKREMVFPSGTRFYAGAGTLVADKPCPSSRIVRAACVRTADGSWTTVKSPTNVPVIRWVPARDGAVPLSEHDRKLMLGTRPTGDEMHRLAWHGVFGDEKARKSGQGPVVDRRWAQVDANEIRAWGKRTLHSWKLTGPMRMANVVVQRERVVSAGRTAILREGDGFVQTHDWGRTFEPITPSPSPRHTEPMTCSEGGCMHDGYLRLGWPKTSHAAAPPKKLSTPAAPQVARTTPRLVCKAGKKTQVEDLTWRAPPKAPKGRVRSDLILQHVASFGLAATPGSAKRKPRQVRFRLPFDPMLLVRSVQHKAPEPYVWRTGDTSHVPLVPTPQGEGWVLDTSPLTWVSPSGVRDLPGHGKAAMKSSPVALDKTRLAALMGDRLGTYVVELSPAQAHLRITLPRTLDAHLGVNDAGSLALIETGDWGRPGFIAPITRSGTWAVAPPAALPDWHKARLADHADCQGKDGFRAIVRPPIDMVVDHYEAVQPVALVRFTTKRACIEAVDERFEFMRWFSGYGDGAGGAIVRFAPKRQGRAHYHFRDVVNMRDMGQTAHEMSCRLEVR